MCADAGRNVGFFRFVADKANDLSSGTLYAAAVKQTSAANGGSFQVRGKGKGKGCPQATPHLSSLSIQRRAP